jgi:hypothetical protein
MEPENKSIDENEVAQIIEPQEAFVFDEEEE